LPVIERKTATAVVGVLTSFALGWVLRPLVCSAPRSAAALDNRSHRPLVASEVDPDTATRKRVFDSIYRDATWGTNAGKVGNSGVGSTLSATLLYRTFLQQFFARNEVKSVVDAGCGDWEFSQALDWTGIDYKGYDIVPSLIEANTKKFGKPNIQFFPADFIETPLPAADVLIVKNVLQHLSNADVARFIPQLKKFKHALLIDGVDEISLSSSNPDINVGDYRPLDLTVPPFSLHGAKVLTYWDGYHMQQVIHIRN
jgi:SAM-dependent methyltransferase